MKKITIILFLLIGFQGFSQDTAKIIELEKVVVSPVRADKRVPVTQKTVGQETISDSYHGQEIPILLGSLPSINSNSDGGHEQGYSYFSLRGATQNRINITLNGVPLNEPEDHAVYFSNIPCLINAIQSIQIQRGVGTSSYGTSSFVGSFNFQSKNGFEKASELQLGTGSYNLGRFNLSTSTGLSKNNYSFFGNIGGITTDGFRNNSGSHGGSVFLTGGYFGKTRVTKLTIFSGVSINQMAWDGSLEKDLKNNYRDNPRGNDKTDLFKQTQIQLHNTNIFKNKSKFTTILFYNRLDGKYDVYSMADLSSIGYYAQANLYSNWFGLINQYEKHKNNLITTIGVSLNTYKRNQFGREYFDSVTTNDYKNYGVKNEASTFLKLTYDKHNLVYYTDIQYRYVDFTYHGDVRLSKQTWNFLNPKVGIKYYFNDDFNLYFLAGLSFREPTRNVMFNGSFYLIDGQFDKVKPERVLDYELGTNYKSKKINFQGNLFLMNFRNEMMPLGAPTLTSLAKFINVNKSLRMGIELDGDYSFTRWSGYSMNLTLSKNTFGSDKKYSLFSPAVILNQSFNLTIKKLTASISQTLHSKSYIDLTNENRISGYSVLGLNISYSFDNITFLGGVNNLLNTKYYSNGYADGNGTRHLYPNALRNFNVTAKIKL